MNAYLGSNYQATADIVLAQELVASCRTRKVRTIREFAEQEIILPEDGGPFEGQPFSVDRQPFVELLWDELMSGDWSEAFITGCVQSGKTLTAFVILLLYMILELRKSPIAAIPDGTMISDKWTVDIEPVFEANHKLKGLLPEKGPGSKGGAPKTYVRLRNGRQIKFLTKGGSDQSKAGYTAPYIVVTEAAGWGQGTETSKESSPLDQVRGRQMSASKYDKDGNVNAQSMLIVEGTVTSDDDLPLSEWPLTSQSRIACPCPHCNQFVTPEREHLRGWQEATSENEAARLAYFVCPSCDKRLSNQDRQEMNQNALLLHGSQKVVDGEITGDRPDVSKLGFRWNAFNNMFLKAADYGAMEWSAKQFEEGSDKWENAEQRLCQQVWVIGYTPKVIQRARISQQSVKQRRNGLADKVVPKNCVYLVTGIDVGKWVCWYVTLAFCDDGTIHVVAHGANDTSIMNKDRITKEHENIAITNCLRGMFDMAKHGWAIDGGGVKSADLVLPDIGYRPEAVFQALQGYDKQRFMATRGRGKTVYYEDRSTGTYTAPIRLNAQVREVGKSAPWHREYDRKRQARKLVVDADYAKSELQNCLRVDQSYPGSISFPKVLKQELTKIAMHFCAELKNADGEWVKRGQNHLLDAGAYAFMGGNYLGWEIGDYKHLVPLVKPKEPIEEQRSWLEKRILNGRR